MRKRAATALALNLSWGTAAQAEGPNRLVTILTAPSLRPSSWPWC